MDNPEREIKKTNKALDIIQTTGGKDEPNIVLGRHRNEHQTYVAIAKVLRLWDKILYLRQAKFIEVPVPS